MALHCNTIMAQAFTFARLNQGFKNRSGSSKEFILEKVVQSVNIYFIQLEKFCCLNDNLYESGSHQISARQTKQNYFQRTVHMVLSCKNRKIRIMDYNN